MEKIKAYIIGLVCIMFLLIASFQAVSPRMPKKAPEKVIASRTFSLQNRYENSVTNEVFKDNILLTLKYMDDMEKTRNVDWNTVKKPFHTQFKLNPGKTFAFHDTILPEYENTVVKTTKSRFNGDEGFRSSGLLFGDGVCHLASFINWVARDAGLEVTSKVNHDFAQIPDVPGEYGTSIYSGSGDKNNDARQNLYVKNNQDNPVIVVFDYDGNNLTVSVNESSDFIAKHK